MDPGVPYAECTIEIEDELVRARLGPGLSADEIEECYRAIATAALERRLTRLLVVGVNDDHAHSHLAARDALIALDELGVPAGFRAAFVARSDATMNGYRHAEQEAIRRGLRVRVFEEEERARDWLTAEELH